MKSVGCRASEVALAVRSKLGLLAWVVVRERSFVAEKSRKRGPTCIRVHVALQHGAFSLEVQGLGFRYILP